MKFLFCSLIGTIFALFSLETSYHSIKGKEIGIVEKDTLYFSADTLVLKKEFKEVLGVEEVKFEKIELLKRITTGETKEVYYSVVAYDNDHKLKMARWLIKRDNKLYYYKHLEKDETDDTIFFRTYFVCYGSDNDCFPTVASLATGYTWSSSSEILCRPDNPCQAIAIFDPAGE